ncbi:glycan-binding surface protein [Thermophagus sp. OGC60D27]|uniref:glycan-binding surface protein n=1 Tax=Thermophagus sp. OGC60D27 TaxID=3458415 RepID=UPI0040379A22
MKNIIRIIIFAFISVIVCVSCENDDNNKVPKIKYIRPVDALKSDSLLASASMGQTIAIIGSDLEQVVTIIFNDVEAKLNPVYVTDQSIIVTIPSTIPEEISNSITFLTSSGNQVVYDFEISIPSPQISSISCEWAPEGSVATLYGSYFFPTADGSINVVFPGNIQADVLEFDSEGIIFTVPSGVVKGSITVTNDFGTGRSEFIYKDDTGIFINGENPTEWNGWNLSDFGTENGIDGTYLKFEGTTGSWAWPANALQLFYINPTGEPLVSEGEVDDYALKFEFISFEWHDTPLLMWFGDHNVDGDYAQYHWKPYLTNGVASNYTTDGWITVTLPLSDFKYDKEESTDTRKIGSINDLVDFNLMWFGAVDETTTEFGLKVWIDNIRLVKID